MHRGRVRRSIRLVTQVAAVSVAWWVTVAVLAVAAVTLIGYVVARELAVWRRTPRGRYVDFTRKRVGV
jgi:hypothetical protein